MKLSEAIIKGCEGTYQVRRKYHDGRGGACPLMAAMMAAGRELPKRNRRAAIVAAFPVARMYVRHPVSWKLHEVGEIVTNLNDWCDWPRLSIAEWLANVVEPEFYR